MTVCVTAVYTLNPPRKEDNMPENYSPSYRDYKSRLFTMLFSDKERCLELYNAVNGTDYDDPEALTINTLENAVYMGMKNDLSFVIDSRISLYEHQSTRNPNLPLRFLFYISDLYSSMVDNSEIYSSKLIRIPAPRFVIFYNGKAEAAERDSLMLSDAYEVHDEEPQLELKAMLINLNRGENEELKAASKTLAGYSEFVARIREYTAQRIPVENAVDRTVDECIKEGILEDFLKKNKSEVMKMSIYEYDEERIREVLRRDAIEEGLEEGRKEGREKGREEGREEGEDDTIKLCQYLIRDKRFDDVNSAFEDKGLRNKLYREYGIR